MKTLRPMFLAVFLVLCTIAYFSSFTFAQSKITVINYSFEKPDSGKVTGFDGKSHNPNHAKLIVVPGWTSDAKDSSDWDSGVEETGATDGKYRAFMMGHDTSMSQVPGKLIEINDNITLTVDAQNTYNAPHFKMELFYLDASLKRVILVQDTVTLTSTMKTYSINFKASNFPNSVGKKIGIAFQNVSDSASWIGLDNVRLTNSDPSIIDVPNYSFEQPDSGKIKGWDGKCADSTWTSNKGIDIPGWTSNTIAFDSGLEPVGAEEGEYRGYIRGADDSVWDMTTYTIKAGDIIQGRVYGFNSYQAPMIHIELIYQDSKGNNQTVAALDDTTSSINWAEYTLKFNANDYPASIGNKLGVLLSNPSPKTGTYNNSGGWLNVDNFKLNNLAVPTAVSNKVNIPATFSLSQNYPNPFNPTTTITYSIKSSSNVRLTVYDILGREVAVLVNGFQNSGSHKIIFSDHNLASGLYLYRLQAGNDISTKKMMLLK